MSTRCNVIIKDDSETLFLYRHSDEYPDCAGADLKEFVKDYKSGAMRSNPNQSAGWLIVRGHFEYKSAEPKNFPNPQPDRTGPRPDAKDKYSGWKVGAYEPTNQIHGDVEYIYIIDLSEGTLTCRVPGGRHFWDDAKLENTELCKEFKTVKFNSDKQQF